MAEDSWTVIGRDLRRIMDKKRPDEGWRIERAVCLAVGSFSRDNWQSRQRSLMQFVAFVDIVKHLQDDGEGQIQCFAQEPQFTESDQTYLASIGVQVIEHHSDANSKALGPIHEHLGPSTFVFEPFMDFDFNGMQSLFSTDPNFYIGSSAKRWIELSKRHVQSESQATESKAAGLPALSAEKALDFGRTRASCHFPVFEEEPLIFEGLDLFWKQSDEED
ncbi:hypothetical protein D0868_03975 [Hortaea werneckii]|uniref:SRR1-like domain-containing protein n=1 Tax=Hortaea werneckii TaxID=91943 RepID=A0A3M7BQH6_HORWE|nr:hypothetical protein D0868_03975 [Hortaea werneckii]RMY42011.1 hypothetical protein D0866_00216 [Hortaea werneckii]